jgi:hypothetical protein
MSRSANYLESASQARCLVAELAEVSAFPLIRPKSCDFGCGLKQARPTRSGLRPGIRFAALILAGILGTRNGVCGQDRPPSPHHLRFGPGAYHPGYYYSRSYLQPFELGPNEFPLTFRLRAYRHYARHRQADVWPAFGGSSMFPYRYAPDFKSSLQNGVEQLPSPRSSVR